MPTFTSHAGTVATPRSDGAARHAAAALPVALPPRRKRVMVAEDNADMRRLIAKSLRVCGYDVVEVCSGNALLAQLGSSMLRPGAASVIHVIVSDVRMPGPNGLTVLAGLRAAGWDIPIILVTAFGDSSMHVRGRELGATAVIDKPFDVAALTRYICSLEPPTSETRNTDDVP